MGIFEYPNIFYIIKYYIIFYYIFYIRIYFINISFGPITFQDGALFRLFPSASLLVAHLGLNPVRVRVRARVRVRGLG